MAHSIGQDKEKDILQLNKSIANIIDAKHVHFLPFFR